MIIVICPDQGDTFIHTYTEQEFIQMMNSGEWNDRVFMNDVDIARMKRQYGHRYK
jgi:hypothetical protein